MQPGPLAEKLNEELEAAAPEVLHMLSAFGRRAYFPKGILAQTAEARQKADRFNATIGIATEGDGPMYLESIREHLVGLDPEDVFTYANLTRVFETEVYVDTNSVTGKLLVVPLSSRRLE